MCCPFQTQQWTPAAALARGATIQKTSQNTLYSQQKTSIPYITQAKNCTATERCWSTARATAAAALQAHMMKEAAAGKLVVTRQELLVTRQAAKTLLQSRQARSGAAAKAAAVRTQQCMTQPMCWCSETNWQHQLASHIGNRSLEAAFCKLPHNGLVRAVKLLCRALPHHLPLVQEDDAVDSPAYR